MTGNETPKLPQFRNQSPNSGMAALDSPVQVAAASFEGKPLT